MIAKMLRRLFEKPARPVSRRRRWRGFAESLEERRMLAVTVSFTAGDLLFFDDSTAPTANTVDIYFRDATGSSLYYSVSSGSLTPSPILSGTLTGVTGIQFLDSTDTDSLRLFGYGGGQFDVVGKNLVFGGTTPITTLNVENLQIDGLESRSPVNLDGPSFTGDVTVKNASVATLGATTPLEVGGTLSVDTNLLQLPGAVSAGTAVNFTLSGGVAQGIKAPITTKTLTVVNSVTGDVLLEDSNNAVDTVSVTNLADSGAVSFADADGVAVGAAGIVANSSTVTVSSGGILSLSSPILAGSGTVFLVAANGINQAAAAEIVARSLTFRNGSPSLTGSNDVDLSSPDNCFDIVAGVNYSNDGDITVSAKDGLSVGAGVGGIVGLTTYAGVITVTSVNNPLSIDETILAGNGGSIVLAAAEGIAQSGSGLLIGRGLTATNGTIGAIKLDQADNDMEFVSLVNSTDNGSIDYRDSNAFTVGFGGITTFAGSGAVTLSSSGSIQQFGAIATRTLSVSNVDPAAGDIILGSLSNNVSFLNLSNKNTAGTTTFADASGVEVGSSGILVDGNALTLSFSGLLSQNPTTSGVIIAKDLVLTGRSAGSVARLQRTDNNVATLAASLTGAGGSITYTDADDLAIATLVASTVGISAAGNGVFIAVSDAGTLTQTGTILADSLSLASDTGDITLTLPGNNVASLAATSNSGNLSYRDADSLGIAAAGIVVTGNTTLVTSGAITQSGRIVGTSLSATNVSTTTGGIVLDLTTNDVDFFTASNAAATSIVYVDANTVSISGITALANVTLGTQGDLIQTGGITTAGTLTAVNSSNATGSIILTNPANNVGSLAGRNDNADSSTSPTFQFVNAADLVVGVGTAAAISVPGILAPVSDVSLSVTGHLSQAAGASIVSRSLDVSNASTTRGIITLTGSGNDTGVFSAANAFAKGSVAYTDANSITLGAKGITADKNAVTLNVAGNVLQTVTSGAITARSLALNNTSTTLGQIAIDNAKNDVDLLAITNAAAGAKSSYTDADGFTIDFAGINAASGTGNVVLSAAGTLDQLGTIQARELTVSTTAGDILLTSNNDIDLFNATSTAVAGTVSLTDIDDVTLGGSGIVAAGNTVNLKVGTTLSQIAPKSGTISAGALNLAASAAGVITLPLPGNNSQSLTVSISGGSGSVSYTDADGLSIGTLPGSTVGIAATGSTISLTVSGAGTLTQTGTILADSLSLASDTGDITLTLPGNNVASLAATSNSGNLSYLDADSLAIAAAGIVVAGNVSLSVTGTTSTAGTITFTGLLNTSAGNVVLEAANGDLAFAPGTAALTVPAGTATILSAHGAIQGVPVLKAADDVIVAGFKGATIDRNVTSLNGSVTMLGGVASGTITISSQVTALSGSITATTGGDIALNGAILTVSPNYVAGPPANGLISLTGLTGINAASPTIVGGRLELSSNTTSPIALTSGTIAVSSLRASTAGDFSFINTLPLSITDFDPTTPSVQVAAKTISIVSPAGLRVVDGLAYQPIANALRLYSGVDGGVRFVPTTNLDNAAPGAAFKGSLRDMIRLVNDNSPVSGQTTPQPALSAMSVVFDEPGAVVDTIVPDAVLPSIVKPVILDGALPTPGDIVGIDGSKIAAAGTNGITLAAGSSQTGTKNYVLKNSTVKNLAIHGFTGAGLRIESDSNLIDTVASGETRLGVAAGNGSGIEIVGLPAFRNTITRSQIVNNRVNGVRIQAGEATSLRNNLIDSNGGSGVVVASVMARSVGFGTQLVGNTITNNAVGVNVLGGRYTAIGDTLPGTSNSISGNQTGIVLGNSSTTATFGNRVAGNSVSDNTSTGLSISYGWSNQVLGNTFADNGEYGIRLVRTVSDRSQKLPNRIMQNVVSGNGSSATNGGIVLTESAGQSIGGNPATNLGNTIIDNKGSGIVVMGAPSTSGLSSHVIDGNFIGTTPDGTAGGNAFDGIRVQGSVGNTITRNRIENHVGQVDSAGIAIVNATASSTSSGNVVTANSVSENNVGIRVAGGARSTVGGALAAQRNYVFANLSDGIRVEAATGTGSAVGTVIRNNAIGVDKSNQAASNGGYGVRLSNATSTAVAFGNLIAHNGEGGVLVEGGSGNSIGAGVAGGGNRIDQNDGDGVTILSPVDPAPNKFTRAVSVIGNVITDNTGYGVRVDGPRTVGATIGRSPSITRPTGAENLINGNGGGGVSVTGGATSVTILGNEITDNGGAGNGIDIAAGSNGDVQAPVLGSVSTLTAGQIAPQYDVSGTVSRAPLAPLTAAVRFYVDFYGTRPDDGRQLYLGRVLATIPANAATGSFRVILKGPVGGVAEIVATSTIASTIGGSTSSYSNSLATF